MRVFCTLCFARNRPLVKDKFASKSRKCVFLGYPFGKEGWKVFHLETEEMLISQDVVFYEDNFPFEGCIPGAKKHIAHENQWELEASPDANI